MVRYLMKLYQPSPERRGWIQKFDIVSADVCFNLIGVHSSDDLKVTMLSEIRAVRISDDPIFLAFLFAPPNKDCGVCQVINLIFSAYLHS